jgi:hypothetical protein
MKPFKRSSAIETVYRCRIDYEWADNCESASNALDKVETAAFKFAAVEGHNKFDCETFGGNPACSPYILLESSSSKRVERVANKIERYINRCKDMDLTH